MSKLKIPDSWALAKLSEVTDHTEQGKPIGMFSYLDIDSVDNKTQTIQTPKSLSAKNAPSRARKIVKTGDVLYSTVRPYLKNIAIVPSLPNPVASTGFCVLRTSNLSAKFVYHYVTSDLFLKMIEPLQKGASYPAVSDSIVKGQSIPVPPLDEQKRIVAKIESTQEKIKTIEESVSKAEELIGKYRESLLQKAFRGQLVPQDPNDEPVSELLKRIRAERAQATDSKKKKKEDLPPIPEEVQFEIPSNWQWVRFETIASPKQNSFVDGPFGSNLNSKHYRDTGIPVLHSGSVARGEFRDTELKHFVDKKTFEELKRSAVYPQDIVIAKIGANYGGSAIVPKGYFEVGLLSGNTMKITVDTNLANINYVAKYLWHLKQTDGFETIVKKTAQPALTLGGLKGLALPLPPLNEQNRIIKFLDKLDRSQHMIHNQLLRLKVDLGSLQNSLFNSAFSGKLVPQVQSEGTGHELLIKIQSQAQKIVEKELNSSKKSSHKKRKSR